MSKLKDLIQNSIVTQGELVSTTVRIPRNLNAFVEEFAEQHSKSKQETLLIFIEEGIRMAKEVLQEMELQTQTENCAFQLLNTSKGVTLARHDMMLKEGIAAAFDDPWKFNIDRIKKGDVVFLYENGVGVVAYGIGTGVTLVKDIEGRPDQCHYQQLTGFTTLKEPITAKEVKKILGYNFVFMRTMMAMPEGDKLLNAIQK